MGQNKQVIKVGLVVMIVLVLALVAALYFFTGRLGQSHQGRQGERREEVIQRGELEVPAAP